MQKTKNTKIFFTTIFLNKKRNFDIDAKNNKSLDSDISKLVDDNFFDLI